MQIFCVYVCFENVRHSYWDDDGGTLASEEIMGPYHMQGGTELDSDDDLSGENIPGAGSHIPTSRNARKHNPHLHRAVRVKTFVYTQILIFCPYFS